MSWAAGRRLLIACIVFVVLALIIGGILFALLYKAPSCTDTVLNQDETGVDCGGSCPYLCTADTPVPVVTFARDIRLSNGRTDVIAYIENPNIGAVARNVRLFVELYSTDRSVISEKEVTVDLPPRSAGPVPVYVPNFFSGTVEVASTFIEVDTASLHWQRVASDPRLLPEIENPVLSDEERAPRLRAVVRNPHPTALRSVPLIATVFDDNRTAIAASKTLIAEIPPGGRVEALFTWNTPFIGDAAVTEIRAAVPLPATTAGLP